MTGAEPFIVLGVEEVVAAVLVALAAKGTAADLQNAAEKAEKARDAKNRTDELAKVTAAIGVAALCARCPPATGVPKPVPFAMSPEAAEYQSRAGKMPLGVEWVYGGMCFDGFIHEVGRHECTLVEAKTGFKKFLDKAWGYTRWMEWFEGGEAWIPQARAQASVAVPPANLLWHLQEKEVHDLMQAPIEAVAPNVKCRHYP